VSMIAIAPTPVAYLHAYAGLTCVRLGMLHARPRPGDTCMHREHLHASRMRGGGTDVVYNNFLIDSRD
jgi:hypothetical protein